MKNSPLPAKGEVYYLIDKRGRKTAAILNIKSFNALMKKIEDLQDVMEAEKVLESDKKT